MTAPQLTAYVNGQGSVSDAQLNTFEQTCDTVAELRGLVGVPGLQVYVRGFLSPGDGGQGPFYWNPSSTAADNGGFSIITPTGSVGAGRWVRIGGSLIVGGTDIFATVAAFQAASIGAGITSVVVMGYYAVGDGGDGLYTPAAAAGAGPGKVQSADGQWWALDVARGVFGAAVGMKADGVTDNSTALQNALTLAITGGNELVLPFGQCNYATPPTLPNQSCALKIKGIGRPQGFSGGVDGDPATPNGSFLHYTGATGDAFGWTVSGTVRVYLTLENWTLLGNSAGSSGHGVHLQCATIFAGFLVCYRDFSSISCKQHNIFHDGNVIESQAYNLRSDQAGDRGFIAAGNGSGIPGETRFFGATLDNNNVGIDLSGGGSFSLHGVSSTANTTSGLLALGVDLTTTELQLELNGPITGAQCTINSCGLLVMMGTLITCVPSATGAGISLISQLGGTINGFITDSNVVAAGYSDVLIDSGSQQISIDDYKPNGPYLITDNSQGGVAARAGAFQVKPTTQSQNIVTLAATGNVAVDATQYNAIFVHVTGASAAPTILNPTVKPEFQQFQELSVTFYNSSGGAMGAITFNGGYALAAVMPSPANLCYRTVRFFYYPPTGQWIEQFRSAADTT